MDWKKVLEVVREFLWELFGYYYDLSDEDAVEKLTRGLDD